MTIPFLQQTGAFIYAVNRLRVNGRYEDRLILSRVSDEDAGRALGETIENRGNTNARWTFVGLMRSDNRRLDCHDCRDADVLALGHDVRHLGAN